MAYAHSEPFLAHREHRGVRRSQANLDFAQASQDRRSVLRIVGMRVHGPDGRGKRNARKERIAQQRLRLA